MASAILQLPTASMNLENSSDSSGSSSDTDDAEVGHSRASAYTARLAALRRQPLQRQIEDQHWHEEGNAGFQGLLADQYRFNSAEAGVPRTLKPSNSRSSSMAVSVKTRSTGLASPVRSEYAPSLAISGSTVASSQSLRTSSAVLNLEGLTLEEGDDGTLQIPQTQQNGRLACSFSFLACPYTSDDIREWDTHCQSHFRGTLPLSITCPFTCDWTKTSSSGRDSWHARTIHIATEHRSDSVDTSKRPNGVLLEHLWRIGVIDNTQLKELRMHGRVTNSGRFRSEGTSHDRRRRRRQ